MSKQSFKRGERLKSRKEIGRLFGREGQSFGQYPLRLVWREMDEARSDFQIQFTVSVPKKRFKKAVQRNRLRRRIREAYRLNKQWLLDRLPPTTTQLAWMVLYVGKEEADFDEINQQMRVIMQRFLRQLKKSKAKTNHQ